MDSNEQTKARRDLKDAGSGIRGVADICGAVCDEINRLNAKIGNNEILSDNIMEGILEAHEEIDRLGKEIDKNGVVIGKSGTPDKDLLKTGSVAFSLMSEIKSVAGKLQKGLSLAGQVLSAIATRSEGLDTGQLNDIIAKKETTQRTVDFLSRQLDVVSVDTRVALMDLEEARERAFDLDFDSPSSGDSNGDDNVGDSGGDDREPNGGPVKGADPGVGRNDLPDEFPVVLDLDRDGTLDLTKTDQGGWVGPADGFLAVDRDGSGAIDDMSEIAFVEDDARARTDLEGLAYGIDSNGDGVVDSQDERFGELQVFQDSNGNRQGDPDELMSLEEVGITSITVTGVPYDGDPEVVAEVDGNKVFGYTDVTFGDGSTIIAGDVVLGGGKAASDADVARMINSVAGFGSDDDAVAHHDDPHRHTAVSLSQPDDCRRQLSGSGVHSLPSYFGQVNQQTT